MTEENKNAQNNPSTNKPEKQDDKKNTTGSMKSDKSGDCGCN